MYTKQEIIIRSYREGKSQRAISRELQISRTTVNRYIEEYELHLKEPSVTSTALTSYLNAPQKYKVQNRNKLKLTREVQDAIDKLLEENSQKKREGLRKQMIKKYDILGQLHQQGFDIGYTTVCNYIRSKGDVPRSTEAFIRQVYSPGDVCEFDWGEVKIYIAGELVRLQLAVFTSAFSNYRYAALYHRQDTLAFMESHAAFFNYVKGVYKQMVYDNMRVAVSKFIGPTEKEPTRALLQMRGHYQFSHRFCNAYRGNEKGHVERSVEYIRRKAFGIKSRFENLSEANQWLEITLEKLNATKQKQTGKTANELFLEEKAVMGALPPAAMICAEQVELRVDKYATVSHRTNRYSVPDCLVGKFIEAQTLSHEIHIYYENNKVAHHPRSYKKHQWIINIEHYLDTFKKKPGALPGSLALASNTYLKRLYLNYFNEEPRDFIDLLDYCRKHCISNEKLEASVHRLTDAGIGSITTEKLKALLGNNELCIRQTIDNKITQMSKIQLSQVTALMN